VKSFLNKRGRGNNKDFVEPLPQRKETVNYSVLVYKYIPKLKNIVIYANIYKINEKCKLFLKNILNCEILDISLLQFTIM